MLPPEPFTINGGCNCRAIRYRISVPARAFRPANPFATPEHPAHLPMVTTDGCNDCRTATASILPTWICVPAEMMSVCIRTPPPVLTDHSLSKDDSAKLTKLPRPTTTTTNSGSKSSDSYSNSDSGPEEIWLPALQILTVHSDPVIPASPLRWYISSSSRARTFCGHCGTNLTYAIYPMVEGFPDIFDTLLGSVDRSDLERAWMAPERHSWWSLGIGWVKDGVRKGFAGPRHPIFKVSEFEE